MTKAEIIATTTAEVIKEICKSESFKYTDAAKSFASSTYCQWVRDRISSISFDLLWDSELDDVIYEAEEAAIFEAVRNTVSAIQCAA